MWIRYAHFWLLCFVVLVCGSPGPKKSAKAEIKRDKLLQEIVTWDENSLMINGERLMIVSGEFHPYRLPAPGLWLDIFQKVKALGFNTVSFYVHWSLVEGKEGDYSAEGIFDLDPFFQAATKAGIYLIARPGPYINAESSGGGFPGWLKRIKGHLRTRDPEFMSAQKGYISRVGATVAKAQITNGGPVILVQPENEYSHPQTNTSLDPLYMQEVEDDYRQAGIVMPLTNNDGFDYGNFAPGSGVGQVDIYGHDSYPLGFDCAQPYNWTGDYFPTDFYTKHEEQSPTTPYTINEFQGGTFDPWGGYGFEMCSILLNNEFERVYNKNDYSFGVKIFSLYMLYGGTNWGNLGFPYGYTSYDYAAAIKEDRTVVREKYSELKLQANFLKVSPTYLIAQPQNLTNSSFVSTQDLTVTQLLTNSTSFWIVRHSDWRSFAATNYTLTLPTSAGMITIPQLGGSLLLNGRDSKIHVTDYTLGSFSLLYSSAEIFTWQAYDSKTILILYGGVGETHELAISTTSQPEVVEGPSVTTLMRDGFAILAWETTSTRNVVQVGSLFIYLLDRNAAYDYWVLDLPASDGTNYSTSEPVIVKAGYLLRTARIEGETLMLTGDINSTTTLEVLGSPSPVETISFNGQTLQSDQQASTGSSIATVDFVTPSLNLPELSSLSWKIIDSLPEIQSTYDDAEWTPAALTYTNNSLFWPLTTPTSLYGSDYGYNTGYLLLRGHFVANGQESLLSVLTYGGGAYGVSIWVNSTFLNSWSGTSTTTNVTQNMTLPSLDADQPYVITVLLDNMGNDENSVIKADAMKSPRGILDYSLSGHAASDITWRLTGNLGGEDYVDRTRGPLNEGGLYAERQGFHLPAPPTSTWATGSPLDGFEEAGVMFYATSFELDLPLHYDIPLSFVFTNVTTNSTAEVPNYRCQLYVNGYQFGKYTSNLGPQTAFPVPEGILNYHGINYIALSLWSLDGGGARLTGLSLNATAIVMSGYGSVELSPIPAWTQRSGAY